MIKNPPLHEADFVYFRELNSEQIYPGLTYDVSDMAARAANGQIVNGRVDYTDTDMEIAETLNEDAPRKPFTDEVDGGIVTKELDGTIYEFQSGKSRATKIGKPNSFYEQINDTGVVLSRSKYGPNGQLEYRDDFIGRPHFDKKTGQYLDSHRHTFSYNEKGQPIGETIAPITKEDNHE